ncbi:MAG: hypothetical protein MZU97_22265 [Bacillus subtilis]|nr:hypothetical protein [Bacillus subtilis]
MTPGSVKEYVAAGHSVLIEKEAGVGSGFSNENYLNAGAKILSSPAKEAWEQCVI